MLFRSHIIETSPHIGISTCYCRHKMEHVGKDCDAPKDICMTFGNVASSLIKYGHARKVDVKEGLYLLDVAYENNLVQCGENVRNNVTFICNCCGCCCEALVAARKFGNMHPVETTNYIPKINEENCIGCGKCTRTCPIGAIEDIQVELPNGRQVKKARVLEDKCLGCGEIGRAHV